MKLVEVGLNWWAAYVLRPDGSWFWIGTFSTTTDLPYETFFPKGNDD